MKTKNLINLCLFAFLVTGCITSTAPELPIVSQSLTSVVTSTISSPPIDLSVTVTLTATHTPTPLPSMTNSVTPTVTPHPTLTVDGAKTVILDLVQKHEGCLLPCLWGFIPGESELETARKFVEKFGIGDVRIEDIELGAHNYDGVGGIGLSYLKDETQVIISWSYFSNQQASQLDLLTLKLRPMKVIGLDPINQYPIISPVFGDPTFDQELKDYLLSSILITYGQPSQVLLTVRPDEPDETHINWHPFSLALYYPEQGIFVEYVSTRETSGSNYIGCPQKSQIYIATWNPEREMTMEYIVEKAGSEIMLSILKPIDEATLMTSEVFYQTFKNPKNTTCLTTPIEIWSEK